MDEPDSFERQKEAMLRFARYLKRVPTLEEGMQLLHDHQSLHRLVGSTPDTPQGQGSQYSCFHRRNL